MFTSRTRTLACFACLLFAGCERPAQPSQQHAELQRLSTAKVKITPKAVDLPIQFGEIGVSVVGPNNSTLGASVSWKAQDVEKLQQTLKTRLIKIKPGTTVGRATGLVLRCSYFDENDKSTGSDDVDVSLKNVADGSIRLKSLGIAGKVARVEMTLHSVLWMLGTEESRIRLQHE